MITVLVAIDAVYQQMVAILLRKERVTEIHSQVAVWPHSRDTSDIQSDHPRRLGARIHGSHSRRMRTTDIRDTTHFTREQPGLKWSNRESSTIR